MCARYNLRLIGTELRDFLDADTKVGKLKPRYNISPSQRVLTLTLDEDGEREIKVSVGVLNVFFRKFGEWFGRSASVRGRI